MSKEGFFGPAALLPPPPSADRLVGFEGPLRPHAFDLTKLEAVAGAVPGRRRTCCTTRIAGSATGARRRRWTHLARNADGDELLFVHRGAASCSAISAISRSRPATTSSLPRGTMWRLECAEPAAILLIEATNASYMLPDKGLLGAHAIFDPGDARRAAHGRGLPRAAGREAPGASRSSGAAASRPSTFPYNPLDAIGWHGDLSRLPHQRARHPPGDEPSLSPAAVGAHDLRRQPLRRLHLRAAPVRDRSGRDQDAVLPQQRRLRRGDLLSRGRFLQPRQHPPGHDDAASRRLHARPAPEGAASACWCRPSPRPTNTR